MFLALISTALGSAPQTQPSPDTSRHIVLISLDGFPSWALDDPYLPVPTLRRLAARGALAKGMRPVNPTVTWPNHTTLITGVTPAKHGVLFNGLLKRDPGVPPRIEPWLHRDEMVRVKTLYDVAHARGPDDSAGGLGGDSRRADRDLGVSGTPAAGRPSRPGAREGGRALSNRARNLRHAQHRLARSRLDPGRRAHHRDASTQPDDVSPAQPGLDAAPLRTAHSRGNDDDVAARCASRARLLRQSTVPA